MHIGRKKWLLFCRMSAASQHPPEASERSFRGVRCIITSTTLAGYDGMSRTITAWEMPHACMSIVDAGCISSPSDGNVMWPSRLFRVTMWEDEVDLELELRCFVRTLRDISQSSPCFWKGSSLILSLGCKKVLNSDSFFTVKPLTCPWQPELRYQPVTPSTRPIVGIPSLGHRMGFRTNSLRLTLLSSCRLNWRLL